MSQTSTAQDVSSTTPQQEVSEEIQALLKQQEEINKKLEGWRKQQEEIKLKEQSKAELEKFANMLSKKRAFTGVKYEHEKPAKLRRIFHNISVIQQKEKALAGERDDVKKECVNEIKQYLEELNAK